LARSGRAKNGRAGQVGRAATGRCSIWRTFFAPVGPQSRGWLRTSADRSAAAYLMRALELPSQLGGETSELNKTLRRSPSLAKAARAAHNLRLALAYLKAADRMIEVDDFPHDGSSHKGG
jgi:hypothetical protein